MAEDDWSEFPGDLAAIMKECSRTSDSIVYGYDSGPPDKTLFHFTDARGFAAILDSKTLWASSARSLADASEMEYAIERITHQLKAGTASPTLMPRSVILDFLESEKPLRHLPKRQKQRAFIASFCGDVEAVHWLHYGHGGTGVAIGFDSAALATIHQFRLCDVVYDEQRQDALLTRLIQTVDIAYSKLQKLIGDSPLLDEYCGYLCASQLQMVAARLKAPAFACENEWRIVSSEFWNEDPNPDPERVTRPTEFRTTNNRVVPYKVINFAKEHEYRGPFPVTEILLGYSAPMNADDDGLKALMEKSFGKHVTVEKSKLKVRK